MTIAIRASDRDAGANFSAIRGGAARGAAVGRGFSATRRERGRAGPDGSVEGGSTGRVFT